MEHIVGYEIEQEKPSAVTLGNFDGLHQGHRELIRITKKCAQQEGLTSIVFTFLPHPMFLFHNKEHSALIMAPEEKRYAMESMEIDTYIEYLFTQELAATPPEEFANDLIFDQLKCRVLVVGEDYKFGAKQKGDYALLKKLGEKRGVKVICVPSVTYEGERVSSTRIRNCLIDKNIEKANRLLTVPYFIMGEVFQGKKLGRTIGFPTINIKANDMKLFPPDGVYATKTVYDGKSYFGVTNIGYNPTVNGTYKVVETNLFDFQKIVYGERVKTYFFKWLRSEKKFPSVDMLKEQMNIDKAGAKEYFETEEFQYWGEKY